MIFDIREDLYIAEYNEDGARVFFIEFKRPGKPTTGPQNIVRKMLESFGFEYYVCDQPGQAEKILENFLAFSS